MLMILFVGAAFGDPLILTGTASTQVNATGTLQINDVCSYNGCSASASGTYNSSSGLLSISLGPLGLPSNANLNSAVLDFGATYQNAGVTAIKTSVIGSYPVWQPTGWTCYWWGLGGCSSWGPMYGWVDHTGSAGSADLYLSALYQFNSISVGSFSVGLTPGQTSIDLLAAGFGPSLLAGSPLLLSGTGTVQIVGNITNYGLAAQTTYNYTGGADFTGTATLNADYSIPETAPVPEPASLMLFGSGLLAGVGALRRKLKIR